MNARSTIAAVIVALAIAALALPSEPAEAAAKQPRVGDALPRVTIALLPTGTRVGDIAAFLPDSATGLLSAGLGRVPASQTYLDIGQGTRLFSSLYPDPLTSLYVTGNRVPQRLWSKVVERAAGAPGEVVPGLMAQTLRDEGIRVAASPLSGLPALIAVDRSGRIDRNSGCERRPCLGLTVVSSGLVDLPILAEPLRPAAGDALIVIERPPPERRLLAFGIVGAGFSGASLHSDSTRMDGYALSTDLFPTIAAIYGVELPPQVGGSEIVPVPGEPTDRDELLELEDRLESISERRFPVLGLSLIGWIVVGVGAVAIRRSAAARVLELFAISVAIMPTLLLLTAALRPSVPLEALLCGLGAPLAALACRWSVAGLLRPRRGEPEDRGDTGGARPRGARDPHAAQVAYGAFAAAAAVTLLTAAVDVIAGSPLTRLSLLGPNPGLGVRFFGIGNELEAVLGSLLLAGCGAAVTAARPADPRRAVAILTAVATVAAVLAFAPGRFGADVGAAIVFPAGAAATVIAALGLHRGSRRGLLAVLVAPALALALLIVIDIAVGGDSHLAKSVLGAGGLDQLADVFDRRITLTARSFPAYIDSPFFIAALLLIAVALLYRRPIMGWFEGRPAAGAAAVGVITATVVGTLANDSGALLLMVGTGYLAVFCGLAWAARERRVPTRKSQPSD